MLPTIDPVLRETLGWACVLSLVFMFITMKIHEVEFTRAFESLFDELGWRSVSCFIRLLAKTFSLSISRQKAELARFVSLRSEIERHVQRYQYIIEKKAALERKRRKFNVHSLNEEQKWLLGTADAELEVLRYRVYKQIQSLEDYKIYFASENAWYRNVWIREYICLFKERHRDFDRQACARRLGCCAASCGCCDRPRRWRGPGWWFMRIVRERWLGELAHCTVDCRCCIQRRGFDVSEFEDEVSAQPTGHLKQEGAIA